MDRDDELSDLFLRYRESCPEVEAGANFMPELWRRIEARRGFWSIFYSLARVAAPVCAVLCLVLFLLNLNVTAVSQSQPGPTYADALAADHTVETTYYAEAIRTADGGSR